MCLDIYLFMYTQGLHVCIYVYALRVFLMTAEFAFTCVGIFSSSRTSIELLSHGTKIA